MKDACESYVAWPLFANIAAALGRCIGSSYISPVREPHMPINGNFGFFDFFNLFGFFWIPHWVPEVQEAFGKLLGATVDGIK